MTLTLRHLERYGRLGTVNAEDRFVKMYKTYSGRVQMTLRIQTLAAVGLLFFISISANAATWYVDSLAIGAKNGTSWANAWANISQITGLSAGDTVYISGGPAGSYQIYPVSSWTPAGGSAGNPITYRIGQDASHNGTAFFSGTGTWLRGSLTGIVISGDAGDGKMHFTIANPLTGIPSDPTTWINSFSSILEGYSTGTDNYLRISYVNFGVCLTGTDLVITSGGTGNEFDHIFCSFKNLTSGNIIFHLMNTAGTTWDSWKIHDNTLHVIYTANNPGYGIDAIQGAGNGVSIYNNTVVSYPSTYSGSQHGDTFQILGGNYWKVYGNVSINVGDMGIYFAAWPGSSYNHVYVYNNIVMGTGMGIYFGSDNAGSTFTDIQILNNVVQNGNVYFGRSATGDTFVNSLVANNAFTGGGGVSLPNNSGTPSINNVNLSDSQAVNSFLSYAAGNISNDYHLKSGATNLIGRGTNLFSCFTNDFAGNARPSSGNWDIGPYVYGGGGGGGGSTNPVILVSPASLDFGLLLANTSTNLTLTVENKGGGTLTGVASVSSPFQIVSGGNYSLGSNQAQTVTVKFNPAAAGTFNQTINFTGGNGANSTLGGLAYVIQSSLSFSSSAGTIVAPFTVASLGTTNYISQTATTGLSDGGKAIYGFSIATAGNYMVSTVVNTPNTAANSFYLNIDGQPTDPTMIWDNPVTSGFTNLLASWRGTGTDTNNQFAPKVFNLSAGTHQLIVRGREGGAGLAGISILPYAVPTAPLGLHVVNP